MALKIHDGFKVGMIVNLPDLKNLHLTLRVKEKELEEEKELYRLIRL